MKSTVLNNDFSRGSIAKNIISQAVPMTVAQLIQVLYNVVDRIYIGHLPVDSTLALTGVGLTFPVITLIAAFTNLFGMGGAPLCSIARGRGDKKHAEFIMGNTFTMLLFCGIVMTVAMFYFKKPILYLFGASDITYTFANEYLSVYLIGTIFIVAGIGMNGFLNSQGFAKTAMATVVIGAVINIILDPIFIFVLGLGIKGAAIATVISQGISAIWVMKFLFGNQTILHLRKENMILDIGVVKEITGLGLAGFIMSATNGFVQIACNATLLKYGGDLYIGVMTILNSVREIFSLPVMGITNGAQQVLGYNYGANKYGRVKQGIKFISAICIVYTIIVWIIVLVIPHTFIQMFNNDPDIILYGSKAMRIYFFGFFMMALQFAGQSIFVSLGKSKQAVFFSLLRKAIIVVPLTILLPQVANLGVNGVFMAEPVSNAVGGIACFATMYLTVWPLLKDDRVCY